MKKIYLFAFTLINISLSWCQSFPNPATLSTGQGAVGTMDPIWTVSPLYLYPTTPPNPIGLAYRPALINNNCAPGAWMDPESLPPPINNGNWITANINGVPCIDYRSGYIYFRLKLNLPAACNGINIGTNGNYILYLSGYVDNTITDVFVNGVSTGISGGSIFPGTELNMALSGPWTSGLNYVDVQVLNMPGSPDFNPYGLLLVADYSASLSSDMDSDGVPDLNDSCPCEWGNSPNGCCALTTPSGNADQFFCNSAVISDLAVTGSNIQWYDSAAGGTLLANSAALTNGTTYYAMQSTTGCTSLRFGVTAHINPATASPSANASQTFCNAATITDLTATGTAIKWYNSATGGTLLPNSTPLVNGAVYYASQTVNNCESSVRQAVSVTIHTTLSPVFIADQQFCKAATLADFIISGTQIRWYAVPVGGTPLANTTALTDGTTYYASQIINNCESPNRLPVTANVTILPVPTGNNIQEFCFIDNPTVANLIPNEEHLSWYSHPTGGTALNSTQSLTHNSSYYASFLDTDTGCESPKRLAVSVRLSSTDAPLGQNDQTFCIEDNPTIGSIMVRSANSVVWFDRLEGGNPIPASTALLDGQHWYAADYNPDNGCYSADRLEITIHLTSCRLEINTLLTLNGNDLNDFISITNIDSFPKNEFQIYNRYGKLVWRGMNYDNINNTFTGKANVPGVTKINDYLPTANYFYVLTYFDPYHNKNQDLKGFIYINNNQ